MCIGDIIDVATKANGERYLPRVSERYGWPGQPQGCDVIQANPLATKIMKLSDHTLESYRDSLSAAFDAVERVLHAACVQASITASTAASGVPLKVRSREVLRQIAGKLK